MTRENPYWQYFSGRQYFEHKVPIDSSSMSRWRKRIGKKGAEELLGETIMTAVKLHYMFSLDYEKTKVLRKKSILSEIIIDRNFAPEILKAFDKQYFYYGTP